MQPIIKAVDKSIAGSHVDVNTTAYRGQPKSILAGKKRGDIITDPGFSSTSLLNRTAESYTGSSGEVAEVRIPQGTEVGAPTMNINRQMHGAGRGNADQELLLGRGRKYMVTRTGPHPRVEVVPRYEQGKLF